MDYQIIEMEQDHIPGVVEVHLASFQGFFLSFLGSAFLRQFYVSLLEDEYGICLVALYENEVVGFVAGTNRSNGVYSRVLRRRFFRFSLAVVPAMIKNPSITPRLFRGFINPSGGRLIDHDRGMLMSIAVLPDNQGQGIGRQLVSAFLDRVSKTGVSQVDLTTDKFCNEEVNLFYQEFGFKYEGSIITPEGREMNKYVINLN